MVVLRTDPRALNRIGKRYDSEVHSESEARNGLIPWARNKSKDELQETMVGGSVRSSDSHSVSVAVYWLLRAHPSAATGGFLKTP